jgi:hypothetical protein
MVVLTCSPEEQNDLIRYLVTIAQEHSEEPGFGLCSIHGALDGTCVLEYIQWRDRDAMTAMATKPSSKLHFARVRHRGGSTLYNVARTIAGAL